MAWVLIFLLLPAMAWAEPIECGAWRLCPYVVNPENPRHRWISIARKQMPKWEEIEVAGRETEAGQALVCFRTPTPPDLSEYGCTEVNRGQLQSLLKEPFMPFYDDASGKIRFYDGKQGRAERKMEFHKSSIKKRIKDGGIDTGVFNR